jgi:5-methylthioadenosine/S-adenosylhomocysteine deaminase
VAGSSSCHTVAVDPTPLFPADLLVVADHVVTMDSERRVVADGAVAVQGDRIIDVGRADDLRSRHPGVAEIGGPGRLAIPGLVNAHQHLTGDRLIHSAIPDHLESGTAIFSWAVPAHAAHTAADDELSATLGLVEAVGNGITFTVEAGTVAHPERVLAAYDHVGVGGTLGTWGWDVDGQPWAGDVHEVLDRQHHVLELTDRHPRVAGWVTLVGHDLMTDELVVAASALARSAGTSITFHLSATDSDARSYTERTGVRPLEHLDRLGALGDHVLVAHGVHLDDHEIDVLLERRVALAYCPWAYLRLGQGVTRAGRHAEIVERGGRVALGCDAENAGGAVDVLRTATLAAGLAKDTRSEPTRFGAHTVLELATIAGAAAIGMAHEIGSVEIGKRADVVLVDTTTAEWIPASPDPVLQLIWASDGRSVSDVVASGQVVVRDRVCTMVDLAELADRAAEHHRRLVLDAALPIRTHWPAT